MTATTHNTLESIFAEAKDQWTTTSDEPIINDKIIDLIIDAYLVGKRKGERLTQDEKVLAKVFAENMAHAAEISTTMFESLVESNKLTDAEMYVRVNNKFHFDVMIITSNEDYKRLVDSFYEITGDLEDKHRKDDFNINFYLIRNTEHLNRIKIYSDGYNLKYDGNRNKAA